MQTGLVCLFMCAVLSTNAAAAAAKIHVITFGKCTAVQRSTGSAADDKLVTIKIRALIIDGRVKEYALGASA
jgi:hypothetical protein